MKQVRMRSIGKEEALSPVSGRKGLLPKARACRILKILGESMPDTEVELNSMTPLELLVATILSAQCTDDRVNTVTPELFRRYPKVKDYAGADQAEVEAIIRPTGFYKSKARNIIACCQVISARFKGKVPDTMEELTTLPGVGRKTANVILGSYFGRPAVVVDTHVKRVANRLDLTRHEDPTDIEYDLQRVFPESQWTKGSLLLLLHGRYVCQARVPKCGQCVIYSDCPWRGKSAIS